MVLNRQPLVLSHQLGQGGQIHGHVGQLSIRTHVFALRTGGSHDLLELRDKMLVHDARRRAQVRRQEAHRRIHYAFLALTRRRPPQLRQQLRKLIRTKQPDLFVVELLPGRARGGGRRVSGGDDDEARAPVAERLAELVLVARDEHVQSVPDVVLQSVLTESRGELGVSNAQLRPHEAFVVKWLSWRHATNVPTYLDGFAIVGYAVNLIAHAEEDGVD